MIKLKINVSAIEKDRLFKGQKGTYLDCIMIETPDGKYGDYMIVQEVSKEERLAGVKGPILGNGTTMGGKSTTAAPRENRNAPPPRSTPPPAQDDSDPVPF